MSALPEWFGKDRERRNTRSRKQEREYAKQRQGKVQAGSGSSWRAPEDVREPGFLTQLKMTSKQSFSLKVDEWRRLRANAQRDGREPMMVIDLDVDGKPVRLKVVEEHRFGSFEDDLIWASALFVGEGCFTINRKYLYATIGMYDRDSIVRFRNAIEPFVQRSDAAVARGADRQLVSIIEITPRGKQTRSVWRCAVSGLPAYQIGVAMYPYIKGTDKGRQFEQKCLELNLEIPEGQK